jgi:hypothetical protein
MAKISIDSEYDSQSGKFATVVTPGTGAWVSPFKSEPLHESHSAAVLAGFRNLELQGIGNVNWHAVVEVLDRPT